MSDEIIFKASFPAIQSAIKRGGDGGMRITLDIPETEIGNAVQLMALVQKRLIVSIQVDYDDIKIVSRGTIQARKRKGGNSL